MPGRLLLSRVVHVGRRLRAEVVGEGRSAYGEQVVQTVAASLSAEYGAGFGKRYLHDMMRFADVFPELEIVHALRSQLGWTHLRELIAIDRFSGASVDSHQPMRWLTRRDPSWLAGC